MQTFARRFMQWWADGWDLLLTPTLGEPPPELGVLNTPDEPFVGLRPRRDVHAVHPGRATRPGSPRSRCRSRRARTGCRSACTSSPTTAARTCCSGSPRSSRPRRRGPTAVPASMPDGKPVRLGGGQGFYGDTPRAVEGLLAEGVDYLCLEALAELTLAILQKDRARDESLGYTRDLPRYLAASLPAVVDGRTKVITNAGGINPAAAAHAAKETAKAMGISGLRIATVLGDDLMTRLDALHGETSTALANLDTGEPFDALPGAAVVRVRVPRRVPDRGGARRGCRHRDHRPGRGRRAVPRPADLRARLGVGRLGPALRRHPRRPPARVLGPGRGRQLLRRVVDDPRAVEPAVPDRRGRRPTAPR